MLKTLLKLFVLSILFSSLISTSIFANEHPQKKLKQINTKIAQIKAVISQDQTKRQQYLKQLKKIEMASGTGLMRLQKTSKALQQQQTNLKQLNQNALAYQMKLDAQRNWLAQQLPAAYYLCL